MNATTHPVAPEEIMALLDGELPSDRSQSVAAHIKSCAECNGTVTSLRNTSHDLASWTVAATPVNAESEKRLFHLSSAVSLTHRSRGPIRFGVFFRRHLVLIVGASALASAIVLIVSSTFLRPMAYVGRRPKQQVSVDNAAPKGQPITDLQSEARGSLGKLTTLSTPGVAADSNGLIHGLRDHAENAVSIEPMIARTVSLAIVAEKDFDGARASLDKILERHNGYAASLNVSTPQGAARSLQASLRIPAPQLSVALGELKALGHVENETQSGEEVTQQHADLVARLKNSRETEQRLQAILIQRTGKISDVLAVEQEIARVRGEIEQMEAEQKALEHRVDFATIDLKLTEEYKAKLDSPAPSASTQLHNASVNGYRNVVDTLLALLLLFAEYGPVLLLWAMLLFIPAWFLWRRWRRAATA